MSSLILKLTTTFLISVSMIGLQACGGTDSDSSGKTAKVEKVKSTSKVKLDPTNADTLLKTYNKMMETQTEENRFKITTSMLILAAGHDPKATATGTFYSYTKGAASLQASIGTPMADTRLRGTFSKAASQHAAAMKGLSDSDLIKMFNANNSLAVSLRKEKLAETITAHEQHIGRIENKASALESEVEDLAKKALGPDDGFVSGTAILGGRVRGTSMLDLDIAANLVNSETTYLSTFPTFTVKVWPKGHPAYVLIADSKVLPVGADGKTTRNIKTVPPGGSQPVLATFRTSYALDMIKKVTEEQGREPTIDDFNAEVRFNAGARFNNPRGVSGGKRFRVERDQEPIKALKSKQRQFTQCENLADLYTRQLEMYEILLKKFEADNSPRQNHGNIQTPNFDDASSQQCLG